MRILVPDLLPATNYQIQVRVTDGTDYSEWSPVFDLTTVSDSTLPATPTNLTWTVVGDSFYGEWDAITTNTAGGISAVTRYEVELVAGATTRVISVPQNTGVKVNYNLSFSQNVALFGTAQATVKIRVRAVDNKDLKSAWTSQLTTSNPAPSPPTSAVVENGVNSISLSWTPPADLDLAGYHVYVGTTAGFTASPSNLIFTGDATRMTYTIATYSTFYFKIRAVDKFGTESADLTASGTPTSPFVTDTTAPAIPTGLAVTLTNNANGQGARAAVSWTANSESDLFGYVIAWKKNTDTVWTEVDYSKDQTTATIDLPTAYIAYDFKIRAYDYSANYSAYSTTLNKSAVAAGTPSTPSGLSGTPGKDSIVWSWTAVSDTDLKTYEVTFSTSATFASGNITYFTGTAATLTVSGLSTGTIYYARVRATNVGGVSGSFSSTANATTGTFPGSSLSDGVVPGTPSAPNVLSGLSYLYVNWSAVTTNASSGAQNDTVTYEVHLSTTSGFTPSGATKVDEVSGTSMVIDHLPGGTTALSYSTTYYVKIIAKDRDGSGSASAQGSGTISKVASGDVTSIGADLIVPGSGFITNLIINTGGSIQSSDYSAGTAGFKLNTTGGLELNTGTVKASALTAGTIGSSTGVIQVAAGASIVMNGGYLKSNTYTGTSAASNPSGAGFYLGNDGIRIDSGTISAAAFSGGSFTTGTITMSGGTISGGGWSLSSSGLTIPNGGISAAALNIQDSANIIAPQWADFEATSTYYTSNITLLNATTSISTSFKKYGAQSLQINATNVVNVIHLGSSVTDYTSLRLEPSGKYIVSYWAMVATGGVANTVTPYLRSQNSSSYDDNSNGIAAAVVGGATTIPADSVWRRYSTVITINANAIGNGAMGLQLGAVGTVYIDGIQVEAKVTSATLPSNWKPPGATTISGNLIKTGAIQSTALAVDATGATISGLPAWMIDVGGNAQFGNAQVRGSLIVGSITGAETSIIQSANYVPGQSGWIFRSDGSGEIASLSAYSGTGIVTSKITADTITAGQGLNSAITLNGSLKASGDMGQTVSFGGAGFSVLSAYERTVTQIVISSGTMTVTVDSTHQVAAGTRTRLNIAGLPTGFESINSTDWYPDSVTSTTLVYNSTGLANQSIGAGTAGIGTLQGYDQTATQKEYISFPTDGTRPNIISGVLNADSVVVTGVAQFASELDLASATTMYIASTISTPVAAPITAPYWPTVPLPYSPSNRAVSGDAPRATLGRSGNIAMAYTVSYSFDSSGNWVGIVRIDERNGAGVLQASFDTTVVLPNAGGYVPYTDWQGFTYLSTPGKYYLSYWGADNNMRIITITPGTTGSVAATSLVSGATSTNWNGTIGIDYTNTSNLVVFYARQNSTGSGSSVVDYYAVRTATVNSTTGIITTWNTAVNVSDVYTYYLQGSKTNGFSSINFGPFDFGTNKYVLSVRNTYQSGVYYVPSALSISTTGATTHAGTVYQGFYADGFYAPINSAGVADTTQGLWWNSTSSTFNGVSMDANKTVRFVGYANNKLTTGWEYRYISYAWRRNSIPAETTAMTTAYYSQLFNRAQISVTIPKIPYIISDANSPDRARIYMQNNTSATQAAYTDTSWQMLGEIVQPLTTGNFDKAFITTTTHPVTSNGFSGISTPATVRSTSGKSFWKGDDTSLFYRTIIGSPTNASLASGNAPALRIGNFYASGIDGTYTAGVQHLRIGDNGIVSMLDDTTPQTMHLYGSQMQFHYGNTAQYTIQIDRGTNYDAKIRTTGGTGAALVVINTNLVAATEGMDAAIASLGTGNTVNFYAAAIHSVGNGLFMDDLNGGGTTGASIGNAGRIVRTTSSLRYKDNVQDMDISIAKLALDLKSVSFQLKEEIAERGASAIRYPGFIAEQADSVGMKLWVNYNLDGQPDGFRYAELTAAHNMLIKDLYAENEDLKAKNADLESRLSVVEVWIQNHS